MFIWYPAIPPLGIYPNKMKTFNTKTWTWMVLEAVLVLFFMAGIINSTNLVA